MARLRGELDRAAELLEEALEITQKAYGPDNADVAALQLDIAEVELDLGEAEGVRARIEGAQKVMRETYGETGSHLDRGAALLERLEGAEAPDD